MEVRPKRSKGVRNECTEEAANGRNANDGGKDVENLRTMFDEIISALVRDSIENEKVTPYPPLLKDGRSVDLFNLYVAVRVRGGCKQVSKKGIWDSVAVELELGHGLKLGLKGIFIKYLKDLDSRVCEIINGKGFMIKKGRFEGVRLDETLSKKDNGSNQFAPDNSHNYVLSETKNNDLDSKIRKFARKLSHMVIAKRARVKTDSRDDTKTVLNSNSVAVNPSAVSRKRKRGSVHDMLKWVYGVATHPMKSAADIYLNGNGYYAQSLLARQLLFVNGPDGAKENSLAQNNVKILPDYYDDATGFSNQSRGILRCSKRVSSKSFLGETDGELPGEGYNCNSNSCFEMDIKNVEDSINTIHPSLLYTNQSWIDDLPAEKHTSVGPKFQAEVPEWTGLVIESDSKWLGTSIWSLEKEDHNNAVVSQIPTRKGRPDLCSCKIPGSVTCTRFHIAEKKLELKRELGSVFYLWKFDKMGEDYALSWSNKEESRFMQMVRRNPPSAGKCFWDCAPRYLRKRTGYMVVNYYFNVFVLRRRMYQNRVTPNDIDSDDDDKEFEILGKAPEDDPISILSTNLSTCSENKQCTELTLP